MRAGPALGGYGAGILLLILLLGMWIASQSAGAAKVVELVTPLLVLGLLGVMMAMTAMAMRKRREEMRQLEGVEELFQLRRWGEAGMLLEDLLSRPMRVPAARAQALIFLAGLLARYHRFEDAIGVQEYLLDHAHFDPGTEFGLKLGRAMAMLRLDHLVDADRAIGELRRMAGERESAGLALVEMYRDVKTGHPEEALRVLDERLGAIREQMGARVADAYGLGARAQDMLGRESEARATWEKATLLTPAVELVRRYPELEAMAGKYPAAAVPAEVSA